MSTTGRIGRIARTFHLEGEIDAAIYHYAQREGITEHEAVNRILRFGLQATLAQMAADAHLANHASLGVSTARPGPEND